MSSLDQEARRFMNQFHMVQQQNESFRTKGKGKGHLNVNNSEGTTPASFDGDVRSCPICVEEFQAGEAVQRFICRHMVHVLCWMEVCRRHDPADVDGPQCPPPAEVPVAPSQSLGS